MNEIGDSVLLGFFTAHALEWLKRQHWFPFVRQGLAGLNRTTAWVVAALVAIGINAGFSVDAAGWHFFVNGPQTSVLQLIGDVLRQYTSQKFFYETTVRRPVDSVVGG